MRAVRIQLTDTGRALAEHVAETKSIQIHTALARVTPGDRRTIVRALRRLVAVRFADDTMIPEEGCADA